MDGGAGGLREIEGFGCGLELEESLDIVEFDRGVSGEGRFFGVVGGSFDKERTCYVGGGSRGGGLGVIEGFGGEGSVVTKLFEDSWWDCPGGHQQVVAGLGCFLYISSDKMFMRMRTV